MLYLELQLVQGKRVRDPKTGVYLELGKVYKFEESQFWLLRLKDGDVIKVEKKSDSPKPKKKKEGSKKSGDK